MEETMIDRLLDFIKQEGVTIAEFERLTGLSNGYIMKMKRRNSEFGYGQIRKIITSCPSLSESWLLTGNGPMLKNTTIRQENNENAVAQNFGTIHNTSHHSAAADANHYVPRATYDDLMDKCHQLERRVHELTDEIISLSRQLIQIQANK